MTTAATPPVADLAAGSLLAASGTQGDLISRLALVPDDELEPELTRLLESVGTAAEPLGAVRVLLLRFQAMDTFSLAAEWSATPGFALTPRLGTDQHHPHAARPYWQEETRTSRGSLFVRTTELPDRAVIERASLQRHGVESYIHTPIRSGTRELGMFGIEFTRRFDDDEQTVAHLLGEADNIATALGVALLRLQAIDDPGAHLKLQLIGAADDDELRSVLHDALGELGRWATIDRARLLLARPEDETVSLVVGWDKGDTPPGPELLVSGGGRVPIARWPWSTSELAAGRVVRVADVRQTPPEAAVDRDTWTHDGVGAVLLVPVVADGAVRGVLVLNRIHPRPWSDRQVHRAQLVATLLHPVIERYGRADRHRQAAERAEASLASTMELIANVSHDLKTPLHAIAGYAELIDDSYLRGRDRAALGAVRSNALLVGALVDDLLAAARPSSGRSTGLRAVAAEAIRQFAAVAEARQVMIGIEGIADDATAPIEPAKARQALRCLMSGALLGVARDGSIEFSSGERDGFPELAVEIASSQPIPHATLAFPVARAVLQESATIEVERIDKAPLRARVRVRFAAAD